MNCEKYQEYISQFIDGELDSESESSLFGHLGSCEQCRSFLKNILSLRNTLTISPQLTIPTSLDQRVLNQPSSNMKQPILQNIFGNARRSQYSFRAIGLAVVFSIATTIFVSSFWYQHSQTQQTIVCLTPLPEVEVNGYVVVASSPIKGIDQ